MDIVQSQIIYFGSFLKDGITTQQTVLSLCKHLTHTKEPDNTCQDFIQLCFPLLSRVLLCFDPFLLLDFSNIATQRHMCLIETVVPL